jgi:ureidoacrylate peracid hydrolase
MKDVTEHRDMAIDAASCALVVVDVQNDFCHEDGAFATLGPDVSRLQAVVPAIESLLELAHAESVPVIHLVTTHGPWSDSPSWRRRGLAGATLDVERTPFLQPGTWGAEMYRLVPGEDDLVIEKHRYSGFAYTPLELALQAKERDTILLAGVTTHACVEATAFDAISRGVFPVLVEDCVATTSDPLASSAHRDFKELLGAVVSLPDLAAAWSHTRDGE